MEEMKNNETSGNFSAAIPGKNGQPKKKNWLIRIILIILSIAVLAAVTYFIFNFLKEDPGVKIVNAKQQNDDGLKDKELSLKEKELELKEKEIQLKSESSVKSVLNQRLDSWINDLNNRSNALDGYYAESVNYYSWGITSKAKLLEDKRTFYRTWTYFNLKNETPEITKTGENKYLLVYDKTINSSNSRNGKDYEAKVRSRLAFEKLGDKWLITEESDDKVYYKNKNW